MHDGPSKATKGAGASARRLKIRRVLDDEKDEVGKVTGAEFDDTTTIALNGVSFNQHPQVASDMELTLSGSLVGGQTSEPFFGAPKNDGYDSAVFVFTNADGSTAQYVYPLGGKFPEPK